MAALGEKNEQKGGLWQRTWLHRVTFGVTTPRKGHSEGAHGADAAQISNWSRENPQLGTGTFPLPDSRESLAHFGFLLSSVSKRGSRPVSPEVGQEWQQRKVDDAARVLLYVAFQQIRLQSWDVYIKV